MVYLTKKNTEEIIKCLSDNSNNKIKEIVKKLKFPEKKRVYLRDKPGIKKLLRESFRKKKKVKMRYYSPHSDEFTTRIVDIYQMHEDCIVAFCHLREEERTFVMDRISSATMLEESYKIPKDWKSESIILNK